MNLNHIPEIDKWAANTWRWGGERFETLKEAKAYIDDVAGKIMRNLIDKYDGYAYIAHYDKNANITSIIEIVPDETSYHRYHYTKPRRLKYDENLKHLVYAHDS